MCKVSISYLFSFPRYQTKCVIEFLFRQLMTSWTLRFIFDHPPKQWPTGKKEGRTEIQKIEYLENEKSFLDEIRSIFHSFWRAIMWWKNKNLMKIADTSFNNRNTIKRCEICSKVTIYTQRRQSSFAKRINGFYFCKKLRRPCGVFIFNFNIFHTIF